MNYNLCHPVQRRLPCPLKTTIPLIDGLSESPREASVSRWARRVLRSRRAAAGRPQPDRVIGANDRINVGVIGVGGRGSYVGREFEKVGKDNNPARSSPSATSTRNENVRHAEHFKVRRIPGLPGSAGQVPMWTR